MTSDLIIEELGDTHPCVNAVTLWVHNEWGKDLGQEIAATQRDILAQSNCPSPMIAMLGTEPAGLASFRRYSLPEMEQPALWLNILYVEEQHRGKGIASELVKMAEHRASEFEPRMYVYTAIPELYEHLGWTQKRPAKSEGNWYLTRDLHSIASPQ